ncbi:MAG TPA: ABC transporter permease [Fimbriimonadaceae bacterium]|nr:ABC transporter permease [Fimbriimonadaceae bacterium]
MTDVFIFQTALKDYLSPRRFWIWVVLGIAVAAMARAWVGSGAMESREVVYGQVSSMLVFRLLALASALFTTAIISQEVEQKTIAYVLTRPVERWRFLFARFVASVLASFLVGAVLAAALSLGVYGADGFRYTPFWNDLKAMFFGAWAYGGLFLFLSLILNRAMIVCLLYAFGIETITPNMPGESGFLAIATYVEAIAQHQTPMDTSNPLGFLTRSMGLNTTSPGTGVTVLVLFSIAAVVLALMWFSRFEYVPREDAE